MDVTLDEGAILSLGLVGEVALEGDDGRRRLLRGAQGHAVFAPGLRRGAGLGRRLGIQFGRLREVVVLVSAPVRLAEEGKTVNGQAADTDTIVASARAYVSALNKLLTKREKNAPAALSA